MSMRFIFIWVFCNIYIYDVKAGYRSDEYDSFGFENNSLWYGIDFNANVNTDSVIPVRSELFFELGGSSLAYSLGYSHLVLSKPKYYFRLKIGTGYFQDFNNPIYDDYFLISHFEAIFYYKITRKLDIGSNIGISLIQNPFLLRHPDYDCGGGPSSCGESTFPFLIYGIQFVHNVSKRVSLGYKVMIFDETNSKYPVNFFPWAGVSLFYKIKKRWQ